MKKSLALIISLLLSIFFLSPKQVQASAPLTLGILKNDAPYTRNNGNFSFYREMTQRLQSELDQKIKIKTYTSAKQLDTALKNKQIQLALSDRSLFTTSMTVSSTVLYPRNVLFTLNDSKVKSLENLEHKKVGVVSPGVQTALLQDIGLKVTAYPNIMALVKALDDKQIQAAVLDNNRYQYFLATRPQRQKETSQTDKKLLARQFKQIKAPELTSEQIVFATYHNKKLADRIEDVISELRETGQLSSLSQKYFTQDLSLK